MFQGETAITIDDKGRLAIPTAYRDLVARACGNRLVITYNPYESGCLWLYPESGWEKVRDQVNALPNAKKVHRNLQLKLVGAATAVEPEGSGAAGYGQQIRVVERASPPRADPSDDCRRRDQRRHARSEAVSGDGRDLCGDADTQPSSGDVDAGDGCPARAQGWQVSGWHIRPRRSRARRARPARAGRKAVVDGQGPRSDRRRC